MYRRGYLEFSVLTDIPCDSSHEIQESFQWSSFLGADFTPMSVADNAHFRLSERRLCFRFGGSAPSVS